jgi:hypothetical protein
MNWLKKLFRRRFAVTIYLKGGQVLKYQMYSISAERNNSGDLVSLKWEMVHDDDQFIYIRLDDVSHVVARHS